MSDELVLLLIVQGGLIVIVGLFLGKSFAKLWATYMQAGRLSLIEVVDSGPNDNEQVTRHFLEIVGEAQQSVELFDDGSEAEGSIYQNQEVADALREKLDAIPDFRVTCYLNDDKNLLFRRELEEHARVTIHPGIQPHGRPADQVHYKIADGGRLAYLSQHPHDEEERYYRRLDCRKLKDKDLQIAAIKLFGPLRKSVEETYRHSLEQDQAAV